MFKNTLVVLKREICNYICRCDGNDGNTRKYVLIYVQTGKLKEILVTSCKNVVNIVALTAVHRITDIVQFIKQLWNEVKQDMRNY